MVFNAEGATIRESVVAIQDGGANIALAVDGAGVLIGIVTDGDVRRALLAGRQLSDPVDEFIHRSPLTAMVEESRTSILDLMQARGLSQVPVVDKRGILVGLHLLRELLGQSRRPNVAMILAGGRGSRLLPMTSETPKPMIEVAGRPILERIVTHLVGFGFHRIALSVGYLSGTIEQHFGNGDRFGCRIEYLREDPSTPLGTGGPLSLLQSVFPDLADPVLVVNGDLITQFDVAGLLESHSAMKAMATIGVVTYTHEVPFGVLTTNDDGFVETITEKPVLERIVSAGIYVFEASILRSVPRDEFTPMTQVLADLVARDERIATWNCGTGWADIGRPQDLARARGRA